MRLLPFAFLSLAAVASVFAAEPAEKEAVVKAEAKTPSDDVEKAEGETTFNGQTVPPMQQLEPGTIDTEISKGYW